MSDSVSDFKWTARKARAAALVAGGEHSDREIAHRLKVTARTLWRWKANPAFRQRVEEAVAEAAGLARRSAIGLKLRRVRDLDRRKKRLERVIDERAADPTMQAVPGGKTGLLVRTVKQIGGGEHARTVEEFAVDVGLLKELREIEKQAAVEMGQWLERREHNVPANIDELIEHELARLVAGRQTAAPRAGGGAERAS